MKPTDPTREETPRDSLGEDLWSLLGEASSPEQLDPIDAQTLLALAESETRDILGEDVWSLLGEASAIPYPRAARPPVIPAQAPPWRSLGLALLAAAIPFIVVPLIRPQSTPAPVDDLVLIRDLVLAENLDLLSHPDFDLLVRWDGQTP